VNVNKAGLNAVEAYVQKTATINDGTTLSRTNGVAKPERDEISISKAARELQEALKAVQSAPDVRESKVEAVKKQVQQGTYSVPTAVLVNRLLSVFVRG